MSTAFIHPTFDGARFDEHTLPLEVAKDLAAYENFVKDLAKALYLVDHPTRRRVPKGFGRNFQLHIESVDDGSAKPLISVLSAGMLALSNAGEIDYFQRSRDLISDVIASATGTIPDGFPLPLMSWFNQFGRSLRADESLTLPRAAGTGAVLTPEIRKHLVLKVKGTYEAELELSGPIVEADWGNSSFQLRLSDGYPVTLPLTEGFKAKLRTIGGIDRHHVFVSVVAEKDDQDRIKRIVSADGFDILWNVPIASRLEELSKLEDGWFEGSGVGVDPVALRDATSDLVSFYPDELDLPFIYPTPEGNLMIEWEHPESPTLEIDVQGKTAEFHMIAEPHDIERTFTFLDVDGWSEVFDYLKPLLSTATI